MEYIPRGVCSRLIKVDVDDNKIQNVEFVGEAVSSSDKDRHDIFLTTKVWCDEFDDARKAVRA